jgi:poly-gamma-glutamate capsule biosynthesis protein CapA/YwtB (metallophosphatase superfamily)
MSNALYATGRNAFANAGINWPGDIIRAILIDTAQYTVDLALHDFLDDIPAGARVATAQLASKSAAAGVCDAADTIFTAVSGASIEAVVLYKDTGVESTSQLIAYIDTAAGGLPVTPDGTDITIAWDTGANKIFKL